MATSTASESPRFPATSPAHPLDPLTPQEITAVSLTVREYIATNTSVKAIRFVTCSLLPPPKRVVLAYLKIPIEARQESEPSTPIVRKAEVDFLDLVNSHAYNAILSFKDKEWVVDSLDRLADALPQVTPEELLLCEQVVKNDERVKKLALAVGVQPEQIRADGWAIGYDERFPQSRRLQQAIMYARSSEHDNLYAHPLDFLPIVDVNTGQVLHIDFPPHYKLGTDGRPLVSSGGTQPPPLTEDPLSVSGRERIHPPLKAFNFLPDLMRQVDPMFKERDDIKPMHTVQPEGVSFKMNGYELEWQNWKMHIAFSQREGIALSTITYSDHGQVRPIFYRLSLAEMVVPYAAPEFPHPRKFAFDVGEYGMGTQANELTLGCDCVGQIHYLPGAYIKHDGSACVIKNVICIHEEDAGVLWKHADYRPGGRSRTVRSRRLVISMVCTLANYEYIWNYQFYQDGSIELEIRLTGIVQVYVSADNEPNPFGTTVAPNINAHYHQHLFSIRVDPMIDGLSNSVIETDIMPLPNAPAGSTANFAGNAFVTRETVLKHQTDGGRDYDFEKDRRWRIVNHTRKHYSTGQAVGYAIGVRGGALRMLAQEGGWARRRAAFAAKTLWVVRDVEGAKGGRLWPSGKYVLQTRKESEDSVSRWIEGEGKIEDEDIVLFITVGTTHIPRPEDWPVMPAEHLKLIFKPQNFFRINPSMDVPGVRDAHSVPAFPDEASVGMCCKN